MSKEVSIPMMCPMCDSDIDHLLHLFFDCNFAKQCWQKTGLYIDMSVVKDAPLWLIDKLRLVQTSEASDIFIKIATIILGIWFLKNKKVSEGKSVTARLRWSGVLKELQNARSKQIYRENGKYSYTSCG